MIEERNVTLSSWSKYLEERDPIYLATTDGQPSATLEGNQLIDRRLELAKPIHRRLEQTNLPDFG